MRSILRKQFKKVKGDAAVVLTLMDKLPFQMTFVTISLKVVKIVKIKNN